MGSIRELREEDAHMNPVRLTRFAGIDFATPKERLLFVKRKRSLWPWLLAGLVMLALFALPVIADCRDWGSTKHGLAFVIDQCGPWPLLEFRIYMTTERG